MLKSTKEALSGANYTHGSVNGPSDISDFCQAATKITSQYVKQTEGRCMNLGERRNYISDLKKAATELFSGMSQQNRQDYIRAGRIIDVMDYQMIRETAGEQENHQPKDFAKPPATKDREL